MNNSKLIVRHEDPNGHIIEAERDCKELIRLTIDGNEYFIPLDFFVLIKYHFLQ